jgi:phosphopantetheine adenylyltransferase
MGGVAGHMDHLYENRDLTFGEMKEILEAAANGELTYEEKVDGQNLFLSYSIPEGKAKGARNKGNLKAGGLDATGLAQKFAGRGNLEKAFTGGFNTFEKAVEALSDEEKERVFGPDTNIWYNAEVMDPGNANVILYDNKTLKIHNVGHFVFDRETGEQSPIPKGTLDTLDNALERMEQKLHGDDFKLAREALLDIRKIEDDGQSLRKVITKIDNEMKAEGLNNYSTISDYMYKRLLNGIDTDLPQNLKEEIVNYILKLPGNIGLRQLKKGLNQEDLQDLNTIITASKSLLQESVEPLEIAIHDFTVELLKGLESIFIADNQKETQRLKNELANAVREITSVGTENPQAMAVMQRHLNKIKDFSMITTPVEAVVFDYNGHTYKFAGNFAPLNQILGMFRYGNLKRSTKESLVVDKPIITEKENNIKKERAKQFVLTIPKFAPSENWGKPGSMERKQIEKVFATIGGGASIQEKFDDLTKRVSLDTNMRTPQRIISTLIILESLSAVINSFSASGAGFVFEAFLSAMLRGKQVVDPKQGSLPIEDLIAFSELEGSENVPISLKLLRQDGKIHGSFTNLVNGLDTYGKISYIVTFKEKDDSDDSTTKQIEIQKFDITQDNIVELLTHNRSASSTYKLFGNPRYQYKLNTAKRKKDFKKNWTRDLQIIIKEYAAMSWPERFEFLRTCNGYSSSEKEKVDAAAEKVRKEKETTKEPEVQNPDTVENPVATEPRPELAEEGKKWLTVEDNRKIWNNILLTEGDSKGGTQWTISPATFSNKGGLPQSVTGFGVVASLPTNNDQIVKIAEKYMDVLGETVENLFGATKSLSDNIDNYFTYGDRNTGIASGEKAVKDANVIEAELQQQISKEKTAPAQRNESLNNTTQVITEKEGKRIALFPGKFKPPHRGHFDYVNKIAKRPDVDEVVVLISPVDYPEVSNAQALKIWNEYLENGEPNITAKIADYRSPVQAVYEFVADPATAKEGDTILLVKSSKDVGDTRFDRAQSYAERHNPGVNVEDIVEDPVQSRAGVVYSARDMRKAIADGDKETFISYIPPNADADAIWAALTTTIEDVTNFIDDTLDEMSAMGGGAVAGYAGGFGPPNNYNSFKKPKSSKPKVRRAKRQRRR